MKTRRLSTILTSAYLSMMLTSSVTPVRSTATLASPVDPMAAQKALQNAMYDLNSAGWVANVAASNSSAPQAQTQTIKPPTPVADPVMTEELMARLMKYVRGVKNTSSIDAQLCKVLELCDGTKDMPYKSAISDSKDGKHYIGANPEAGYKDILIIVVRGDVLEAYLTDSTGKLRAAAVVEKTTTRLITNEKAAEKYKAELSLFAGEAGGLPPTGTAVAGNS